MKANDKVIYICEDCGNIMEFPRISTYTPNLICHNYHGDDGHYTTMTRIWPRNSDEILESEIKHVTWKGSTSPFEKSNIREL